MEVGSTTFEQHLFALTDFWRTLADPTTALAAKYNKSRTIGHESIRVFFAREVLPDKEPEFVADPEKMSKSFNFLFARNPFSRLSSAYYNLGLRCFNEHKSKACLG